MSDDPKVVQFPRKDRAPETPATVFTPETDNQRTNELILYAIEEILLLSKNVQKLVQILKSKK